MTDGKGSAEWSAGLREWYVAEGRHDLPWRHTTDPWAILVSEVMLQQTQVARVVPRWRRFVERWPAPEDCAAASVGEVLREWQGLGYPRRALALHRASLAIVADGWPGDESTLRQLPGVGAYTARALLVLAFGREDGAPPQDVNLRRVAARAGLGVESHEARPADTGRVIQAARPEHMPAREYTYAMFDIGALVCTARSPRCGSCPIMAGCRSHSRLADGPPAPPPTRQKRFQGSFRQLRGAVLRACLAHPPPDSLGEVRRAVAAEGVAATRSDVARAHAALVREGLLAP